MNGTYARVDVQTIFAERSVTLDWLILLQEELISDASGYQNANQTYSVVSPRREWKKSAPPKVPVTIGGT